MIKPIHPFPARMAPEIAIAELSKLQTGSVVLDPMMGSGTVLRHAIEVGHQAIGFDMDPLALLMSRVWSTWVSDSDIEAALGVVEEALPKIDGNVELPWIDDDPKTAKFVKFWFGEKQRLVLRRLSFALDELGKVGGKESKVADVLRVALSRIIITKGDGASLAHDVSHSRPHRVMESSEYDVLSGFRRSLKQVRDRLRPTPKSAIIRARLGDARKANYTRESSVDMVLTSPPYLNAIDYMRGHKLSLVWLGHSIAELSTIRSTSVGAERAFDGNISKEARAVQQAMVCSANLQSRHLAIVERYSADLLGMMEQVHRSLKGDGTAILVVGDSCLKGTFIKNSAGVIAAGKLAGLHFKEITTRNLPAGNRYLPMPKASDSSLGKRMRAESVVKFTRSA